MSVDLVDWAFTLSERLLAGELPRRWAHSQGVALRARGLAPILGEDADLMVAAAVLHDIGYASALVDTGLHPLDGAVYLRDVSKADERVVSLVAYHSCAHLEAEVRGIRDQLVEEFTRLPDGLNDALCYCDMNTTPDGLPTNPVDRVDEIAGRYGPESLIGRFIRRAEPEILRSSARVNVRMADARSVVHPM